MPKGDACFYCRNAISGRVLNDGNFQEVLKNPSVGGWGYDCRLGLENESLNGGPRVAASCSGFDPRIGFQIEGYYTHMWFEKKPHGCLTWIIQGDGEFPVSDDDAEELLEFSICDFTEIENFVRFWGKELRKRGWIAD